MAESEQERGEQLTPEPFRVLRRGGTERPLSREHVQAGADGVYRGPDPRAADAR